MVYQILPLMLCNLQDRWVSPVRLASRFTKLFVFSLLLSPNGPAFAEQLPVDAQENAPAKLLLERCASCHGNEYQEGRINVEAMTDQRPLVRNIELWTNVIARLENREMPPEDADQPTEEEYLLLLNWLDKEIKHFDYSSVEDPGFEPLRRLTHRQYDNTVRDLLGVDLHSTERFPSELTGASGFENSANTLFLQSSLMERYIGAAERLIDLALPMPPKTQQQLASHQVVFVASPEDGTTESEAAEQVLSRFLLRAYRRPVSPEEVNAFLGRFKAGRESGMGYHEAIKHVLPVVLISPNFLLRIERGSDTEGSHRISDWELASRLSYFMWNSMPDDELFDLAEQGDLHKRDVLSEQVSRMLEDEKADSFGEDFAAQWLSTRLIGSRIFYDPIDNPWCTDSLMEAMRNETSMFVMSLLRENRSIDDLIDSDYTFMNEELAKTLYGMDNVKGDRMRRVALHDRNRGGILTQPSVLAVTSGYFRTSPVKRGIYVLETILGTPPPPPPPGASELDEELEENDRLSFREKLELHSRDDTCRACHVKIDPLGLALENFDYFGRWRDKYRRRKPIDASAVLDDGTKIEGPDGLKYVILQQNRDDYVRQLVSKMLAYGLGRQLEYYDEMAIRKITTNLEADDYHFQTLIQEVVSSYPFQNRKNREKEILQ